MLVQCCATSGQCVHIPPSEVLHICRSTAENKDERLADESIHLGSGFLVAGFRHVIGCLWPSSDRVCVEIAREFYRELDVRSGQGIDDMAFARALHIAVGKAYITLRDHPLLWAQYIHIGA